MNKKSDEIKSQEGIDPLPVMGIFILIFGLAVISAIFFTDTFKGKITNLIAGLTFLCCAGIAFLMARKNKRKNKV